MELTGKIIAVLPERSGVSQRTGTEWRCASYVLETMEQYPRKMNFEVFGADRIQQFNIQQGETMVVYFDIDAREFHRQDGTVSWINSIRAWKVDRNLQAAAQMAAPAPNAPFASAPQGTTPPPFASAPQAAPAVQPMPADPFAGGQDNGDDLPF